MGCLVRTFCLLHYFLFPLARGPVATVAWDLIGFNCGWAYSVFLHWRYGQTVGKRFMGVKVLDVSEKRLPTFFQAFLRDIGDIVCNGMTIIYLILLVRINISTAQIISV
jgi:uncharacterized RDD family membrane protein YckC